MGLAERFIEAWNSRDGQKVAALMTEDGTYEDLALGEFHRGREAVAGFVHETARFAPDFGFKLTSAQESPAAFCIEWEFFGTNTGGAPGFPVTNMPFRFRGVSVAALDGGKIKQNRDYWNMVEMLTQQGLMPAPAAG